MRETKFSFSIIGTLNSIFEFTISISILCHFYHYTQVSTLIPCNANLIPHVLRISIQIFRIPTLTLHTRIPISFFAFPPLSLRISLIQFPNFTF